MNAELLRALGAVAISPPPDCRAAAEGLGLPVPTRAEHTGVFVLSAPPYAAIHLGGDGKLGGEGADRVAGFWRALGLAPPQDADHLGALLMLHAELGDAAAAAGERAGERTGERTRDQLARVRDALLWEHLWSWAPGYLAAVERLGTPSLGPWARLTLRALAREAGRARPAAALPLALRSAPPPLAPPGEGPPDGNGPPGWDRPLSVSEPRPAGEPPRDRAPWDGGLLDAVLAPARSGLVLLREDLREAAAQAGVGYRLGERRYTLQAMLDQDPAATLGWLAGFARSWADRHLRQPPVAGADPRRWWAGRAAATARTLHELQRRFVAAG